MAPLLISTHRFLLFLVLVQSASLYKIYTLDENRPNVLTHPMLSSDYEEMNPRLPVNNFGYDDNNDDIISDTDINRNTEEDVAAWLALMSEQQKSSWKRSTPVKLFSTKSLIQRRNSRPHWNPLVAAYKRCGELTTRDERESCFKDAIQMLFVHKLRK